MNSYIQDILDFYHHKYPNKPHLSPHKNTDISYGSLVQYDVEANSRPPLDSLGTKQFQSIVGEMLYYARDVKKKIIVDLSPIGSQQASTTECTFSAITHSIEYISTYPNGIITLCAIILVLSGHSGASFLNESKANSRAGP